VAEERKAEEFFYTDDDSADGVKRDADLHNAIINPVDYPIDEKIMAPIRARHRAAHQAQQSAKARALRWPRVKGKALQLLDFDPSQPRDEHGRWSDGGGSDDAAAVPDYKPGVRGRGTVEVERKRDAWVAASPIKTIDDVVRAAPIAQKNFAKAGRRIADELGITFKDPGPKTSSAKGIERTKQKIVERKGVTARVTDTARGAFVLTSPDQADAVIAKLARTHEVLAEPWRTVKDSHYTDRALLFRDRATGLIGEVQITEPRMLEAKTKGGGHELYEAARVMKDDDPGKAGLNAKMQALYGAVLDGYNGTDWAVTDGRPRL